MSPRAELGLAYAVGAVAFAAAALWAGQDANWDLQNYHLYAARALLHWRYPLDVGAGGFQGYFNPIPYLPNYLLLAVFPPVVAAVVIAGLQAAVVPLAWAITGRMPGLMGRPALRALAAAVGCGSAMVWSEVGTSFADLLLAPLVLGGVLALLRAADGWRGSWVWAGGLIGMAAGLKLTNGFYAAGLGAAALLPWPGWRGVARRMGWLAVGFAGGLVLTGGAWMAYLWAQYGNPVFPAMNTWFHSSSAALSDYTDRRFLPAGVVDALTYPWRIAVGEHPTSEAAFADPRLLLALPLALVAWRSVGRAGAFLWGAVPAWLGAFAIQRYAVGLDILAGIVAVQSVAGFARGRARVGACLAVAAMAAALTRPAEFWHRAWADAYVPKAPPALDEPAAFLMLWHPDGYWVEALPDASRFYTIVPIGLATGGVLQDRLIRGLRDAPGGRVWTMGPDIAMGEVLRGRMAALGFVPAAPCVRARSYWWVDTVFCRAAPAGERPLAAPDLPRDETVDFSRSGAGWIYELSGWMDAGVRGVAAVGPSARLVMRPAPVGAGVLALEMDGKAPISINGVAARDGSAVCLPPGSDVNVTLGDPAGPPLSLTLRTMRLRAARPGEC